MKYLTLGVGQVVLQAAASNKFKECFGIEKAETPAYFAKELEREFKKWMNWFGKIYTDFTVIQLIFKIPCVFGKENRFSNSSNFKMW